MEGGVWEEKYGEGRKGVFDSGGGVKVGGGETFGEGVVLCCWCQVLI